MSSVSARPFDGGYLVEANGVSERLLRTGNLVDESVRLSAILGVEPREIVAAVNKSNEREVKDILEWPNPLEALKPYLDELVAGEDSNKLLLFTLLLSGLSKDPRRKEMILLKSESGAGKTTLANALTKAFKTKKIGRFSEHALDYSDLGGYQVLYIQEIGHMDEEKQGVSTVKFLSADDEGYTVEVTAGDIKEGYHTETRRIPPITVVSSTTRVKIDPQFERRCWIISIDETPEQTERIRELKAKRRLEENERIMGLRDELSSDRASKILKRVAEKVQPVEVIILFPETLMSVLENSRLRSRGDYEKMLRLLEHYCSLKAASLPRIGEAVVATPEAALEILRVALDPLTSMTMELDRRTLKLLEGFRRVGVTEAGMALTPELRDQMSVEMGYASRTLRAYLSELVRKGYLTDDGGRPKTYKLTESLKGIERKLSALSVKLENTASLTREMCREAQESLGSLSAKMPPGGLDGIREHFNEDKLVPPEPVYADSDRGVKEASEPQTTPNKRRFREIPKCAACGSPLNENTGIFMDPQTGNHYCRQHYVTRKRLLEVKA